MTGLYGGSALSIISTAGQELCGIMLEAFLWLSLADSPGFGVSTKTLEFTTELGHMVE